MVVREGRQAPGSALGTGQVLQKAGLPGSAAAQPAGVQSGEFWLLRFPAFHTPSLLWTISDSGVLVT